MSDGKRCFSMTEDCNIDGGISLLGLSYSSTAIDETKIGKVYIQSMLWVSYIVQRQLCCCPSTLVRPW